MDIKILLLGLLFTFVDVFPAYAVPAVAEEIIKQESSDNYQTELQENKIEVAMAYVKAQGIKAKALLANANAYSKVTNERKDYYLEYQKLAEESKEKARIDEQRAVAEAALLDGIESKRKEWEVRSREAEAQGKNTQLQAQRSYADAQEWTRKLDVAVTAAAIAEAEASGYEALANKEKHWGFEVKSKAEEILHEATRNHYAKAKEAEQKATTNKVKAQQQAEEADKHLQAAKALEAQVLRLQVASLDNLSRYIGLTIQAEEAANKGKEDDMTARMEEMMARELTKRAQRVEAIYKIMKKECELYESKAKKKEGEASMLSRSAREANSAIVSHSASMLKLASVKEDSEIEPEQDPFADHQLKNMPFVAQKVVD